MAINPFDPANLANFAGYQNAYNGLLQSGMQQWVPSVGNMLAGLATEPASCSPQKPLPEEHVVSALIGYRAWNVPLFVDELRSVAVMAKWKPYEKLAAACAEAQCDGVGCNCGIYAFKTLDLVQRQYKSLDHAKRYVWGQVWLWGRVLECKDGYRAQFAYPKSFVNSGAISKRMAEVFGVSLEAGKL